MTKKKQSKKYKNYKNEYIIRCRNGYCIYDKYNGDKVWYNSDGKIHRDGKPAIKTKGAEYWYQNGKIHRDNGPAVYLVPDIKQWWQHGKLHRTNGPAIEESAKKEWWLYHKIHRINGPAVIIYEYGAIVSRWLQHGKRHRLDGPADNLYCGDNNIEYVDEYDNPLKTYEWWLYDNFIVPKTLNVIL